MSNVAHGPLVSTTLLNFCLFTAQRVTCSDKLNNCAAYGQSVCTTYGEWAHDNCQQFCGFCGKIKLMFGRFIPLRNAVFSH